VAPVRLHSGSGFALELPQDLVDRAVDRAQTLEFRSSGPDDLVMKVLSIELQTG
jgi:hypothetical protein